MAYRYTFEKVTNKGSFIYPIKARYLWWVYKIGDVDYFISSPENSWGYFIDIPRPGKIKTVQEARIYKFYEILNHVDNVSNIEMLYNSVSYDENGKEEEARRTWEESGGKIIPVLLEWYGNGLKQSAYRIVYNYVDDKIYYDYSDIDISEEEEIEGELTREEFNLLMQIYFGVYDDEMLVRELEEKESRGEFEGLEKIEREDVWNLRESDDEELKRRLYEYLLLKLSRKSMRGAFEDMEREYRHGGDRLKEMEREIEEIKNRLTSFEKDNQKHRVKLLKWLNDVKVKKDFFEVYKLLRYMDRTYGKRIDLKERDIMRQIVEKGEGIVPLPGDEIDVRIQESERKINELFYRWDMFSVYLQTYLRDAIQSKKTYEQRLKDRQVPLPKIKKHYDFRRPEEEQQEAVDELKEELEPTIFKIVEAKSG